MFLNYLHRKKEYALTTANPKPNSNLKLNPKSNTKHNPSQIRRSQWLKKNSIFKCKYDPGVISTIRKVYDGFIV